MHKIIIFSLILIVLSGAGCTRKHCEYLVSKQGAVIELDGVRLEIPSNTVPDSTVVRLEKRRIGRKAYEQGYILVGESLVIQPETLVFENPVKLTYVATGGELGLGARIGSGFVPLAGAEARGDTLIVSLIHAGEYYLIEKPQTYGIVDYIKTDEGLLIVSDIYVSDYVSDFKQTLRKSGYDLPVWLFIYKPDLGVEENARLMNEELHELHNEYGEFRLDVVSFGIGGLVTHRYLTDSLYYQRDISSAVIAIGTPFFGSHFGDLQSAQKGKSPFRFFFVDGMKNQAQILAPGSEFISLIENKRRLPGYHYHDDLSENKNFVSLHGQKIVDGDFPEESSGDGLVSLKSAMLTAIEPAPFPLDHFSLMDGREVHDVAADFVLLYRDFNWPLLFSNVWNGRTEFSKITETWERETRLHFRDDDDLEALLEYNKNMLNSCPDNAILITNGDYDTYPAWYLQGKGFRSDVLLVNRSLLNLKEYAKFLMRQGLPLDISEKNLDEIKHEKIDEKLLTISDQLVQRLLRQTSRPVVLSTTVYAPAQYGYPLMLSGLVYEIGEPDIDVERTEHMLYEVFDFSKISTMPIDSFSVNIQNMVKNYGAVAFTLSAALDKTGQYERAIKVVELARRFSDEPVYCYHEAQLYFKVGKRDEADHVLERLLETQEQGVALYKEVARIYYENGMREKAITVLASVLSEEPGSKEIADMIKKYQEE